MASAISVPVLSSTPDNRDLLGIINVKPEKSNARDSFLNKNERCNIQEIVAVQLQWETKAARFLSPDAR